jgi:hypothetical protein
MDAMEAFITWPVVESRTARRTTKRPFGTRTHQLRPLYESVLHTTSRSFNSNDDDDDDDDDGDEKGDEKSDDE